MSKTITVITPVYNRSNELEKLYRSLKNQNDHNFEWFIINDGSSDLSVETEILKWKKTNIINITYIYQNNSGKMAAYKKAINLITSDYSIVVDSDDWLSSEAISIMKRSLSSISSNIGIAFPRRYPNNTKLYEWERLTLTKVDIISLKYEYKINETALLINNKVLKEAFKQFKY